MMVMDYILLWKAGKIGIGCRRLEPQLSNAMKGSLWKALGTVQALSLPLIGFDNASGSESRQEKLADMRCRILSASWDSQLGNQGTKWCLAGIEYTRVLGGGRGVRRLSAKLTKENISTLIHAP